MQRDHSFYTSCSCPFNLEKCLPVPMKSLSMNWCEIPLYTFSRHYSPTMLWWEGTKVVRIQVTYGCESVLVICTGATITQTAMPRKVQSVKKSSTKWPWWEPAFLDHLVRIIGKKSLRKSHEQTSKAVSVILRENRLVESEDRWGKIGLRRSKRNPTLRIFDHTANNPIIWVLLRVCINKVEFEFIYNDINMLPL